MCVPWLNAGPRRSARAKSDTRNRPPGSATGPFARGGRQLHTTAAPSYYRGVEDNAAARAQSRNALGQAYLLVGKNNVTRIDVPESDAPIAMDDVQRSVRELPMVARSLVEGAGHHIERVFLDGAVEKFIRCPMTQATHQPLVLTGL